MAEEIKTVKLKYIGTEPLREKTHLCRVVRAGFVCDVKAEAARELLKDENLWKALSEVPPAPKPEVVPEPEAENEDVQDAETKLIDTKSIKTKAAKSAGKKEKE